MIVTHIVEVGSAPLDRPLAEVFGELVRAEVPLMVWHLERSTREWFFYDPDP